VKAAALLNRIFGKPAAKPRVRARYDAAQTSAENRRHWSAADHLSADAALSPEVRRVLRARARYEVANNGYARGVVQSLANAIVGVGPKLQMLTEDAEANATVEREFARWARAVGLERKLWTMRVAQAESGEVFAVLATNPRLGGPVTLDLRLVEADRVTTPLGLVDPADALADGIEYDEFGNPVRYTVLRRHPGDTRGWKTASIEYDTVDAGAVIHLYRVERPGQSRGVPEITASLPLFAQLRRYTLAVLNAAENAALTGGVIYTDAPADAEAAAVEPMDEVDLERGTWLTMPFGWKVGQVKAEQPTTVYGDFKRELLNEIARPLHMPYNVAAGNSSGYNYASGRLDHQAFFKAVRIDRTHIERLVLDRVFAAWLSEAVLIEGLLPQSLREIDADAPHQWFWDGFEHVDPAKEASAQATRLSSHATTLAAEYARQGLDWETELRQRAREVELMRELGLSPAAAPAGDTNTNEDGEGPDEPEPARTNDDGDEADE
jgi:lambda family phage portal protein